MKNKSVGNQIKEIREEKGLSMRQVAEKAGISDSRVSDAENGKNVTKETLEAISSALGEQIKIG